ncbi:HAD family hydrolase [Sphingomonas sp. MMS24-J13]|uniref:HAD family hydrolase n=1 Tax=Sphingomonas sp. MMS24-J13 TaxID=3238686 RepID=UPI00384C3621
MRFDAILFDFDGVLIESEHVGNLQLGEYLTRIGHPTTAEQSMAMFMGLAGQDFLTAVEGWIGRSLPEDFHTDRATGAAQAMAEGLPAVAGAVAFVRGLPPALPVAVVSSSSTEWINAHLAHLGLTDRFGDHVYSGREHVERGKPAPDLYLFGARQLGVDIARAAIIEDSPIGATGAVESGAFVIGLCAGSHCGVGHADVLRGKGVQIVADSFDEVQRIVSESPGAK